MEHALPDTCACGVNHADCGGKQFKLIVDRVGRMQDVVEDLAEQLENGKRIYAHCWGGRGRAGTLGACLLARIYGMPADEALHRVQRAFNTRTEIGAHDFHLES